MTLLEVVVSVLILGLVASAVASVMAYTLGQQQFNTVRLGAYELANRLMIQYLDDEDMLNSMRGKPLDYAGRRFHWDCKVEKVTMNVDTARPGTAHLPTQYLSRFELVSIAVWRDGNHRDEPLARLTRLIDPAFLGRNPDSLSRLAADPNRAVDYSLRRLGIGAAPGSPPPRDADRGGAR